MDATTSELLDISGFRNMSAKERKLWAEFTGEYDELCGKWMKRCSHAGISDKRWFLIYSRFIAMNAKIILLAEQEKCLE